MLKEKQDLIHEFPEYTETIHNLKSSDVNFARLSDEYNEVYMKPCVSKPV